jgi:hypothetical protein
MSKRKNDKRKNNDLQNKTCLTPPLFIEVSVPRQESEWSGICVLGVSMLPFSTIFLLEPLRKCGICLVWFSCYRNYD